MIKAILFSIFTFFLPCTLLLASSEYAESYYSEIDVREITIENGMKVYFKPTKTDLEQVAVRILAKKGYLNLEDDARALYEREVEKITQEGVGPYNRDQLSMFFYKNGIDCVLKIDPYARVIDANMYVESLPIFFNFIRQVFEGNREMDHFFVYPHEFIVIIVGDTTLEQVQTNVTKPLREIKKEDELISHQFKKEVIENLEAKHFEGYVFSTHTQEITLYLPYQLDEEKHHLLTMLCVILKERLITALPETSNCRVNYEVPAFPHSIAPQMRIRYKTKPAYTELAKQVVYREINRLKQNGPSVEEMQRAYGVITKNQPLLLNDNYAWTGMISNFALLDWKLEKIVPKHAIGESLQETAKVNIRSLIPEIAMK